MVNKKTQVLLNTRSNFWGGFKILKLKKIKWKRIRRQLKIKPQFLRLYKKRLKPQQQFVRRFYKRNLLKKQHFKLYYGNLKESQLKKLFLKTKKQKSVRKTQLDLVINHLEQRLDIVVFRMGFANSIDEAHNLIMHKKILVNGCIVKSYNYLVKPNDLISIHPNGKHTILNTISHNLLSNYIFYLLIMFPDKFHYKFRQYKRLVLNLNKKPKFTKSKRKLKKKRTLKKKYNLNLIKTDFTLNLYKFKNKNMMIYLNKPKATYFLPQNKKYFNFYQNIRTTSNVIINYKTLMGIFLYTFDANSAPFVSYMDLKSVQRYYNKQ